MEIKIELSEKVKTTKIIIQAKQMNKEVEAIYESLSHVLATPSQIVFYKKNEEFYFPLNDILFFETSDNEVYAHTYNDAFEVKFRLYELESLLPHQFIRISKSSILNINHIYSIQRNLASASLVQFQSSKKQVYVSRMYFAALRERLKERGQS